MRKKHTDVTTDEPVGSENTKHSGDKKKSTNTKGKHWALVIMVSTFFLAMLFSLVTEIASSKTNIIIASLLLLLLIAINILFDGIAISVASCDLPPLLACASRKVAGAKTAIKLVKNSDKVNNFCADVIGDICGIVSGGCAITIVAKVPQCQRIDLHHRYQLADRSVDGRRQSLSQNYSYQKLQGIGIVCLPYHRQVFGEQE